MVFKGQIHNYLILSYLEPLISFFYQFFIIFYNNSSNYLVCKVYDAGQDLLGEATNLTSINTYPFDIVELGDGKVLINYNYSSQSVINDTSNILYHLIVIESNLSVNTFTFETDCGIYLNTIQFGNTNVYSQSSLIDTNKVFIIVTTNNAPYGFVADFSSDDLISYPLSQVGSNISVFSSVSVLENKLILNYISSQQNFSLSPSSVPENNPLVLAYHYHVQAQSPWLQLYRYNPFCSVHQLLDLYWFLSSIFQS